MAYPRVAERKEDTKETNRNEREERTKDIMKRHAKCFQHFTRFLAMLPHHRARSGPGPRVKCERRQRKTGNSFLSFRS